MQTKPNTTTNPRASKNALKLNSAKEYVQMREKTELTLGGQVDNYIGHIVEPYMVLFFNRIMDKTRNDCFEIIEKATYPDTDNINPGKWDRCEIEMAVDGMLDIKKLSDFYIQAISKVDRYNQRLEQVSRQADKAEEVRREHYMGLATIAREFEQKINTIDFIHLELDMLWTWQLENYPNEAEDINACYSKLCRILIMLNRYFVSGHEIETDEKGGAHA